MRRYYPQSLIIDVILYVEHVCTLLYTIDTDSYIMILILSQILQS